MRYIKGKWATLLLILALTGSLLGSFVLSPALDQDNLLTKILRIGQAGVTYAIAPDYTVDGTDDDVQIQEALDALPATGGKIILYGGNYDFGATVSRAINNVVIEGSGKATYLANNASTALITCAGQTGWVFQDLRTDAGGLGGTFGSSNLRLNVWIGDAYYFDLISDEAFSAAWDSDNTAATKNAIYDQISQYLVKQMLAGDSLILSVALSENATYCGITEAGTAGDNLTFGNLVYLGSDGKWELADSDNSTTSSSKLAIVVSNSISENATGSVLLYGKVRVDSFPDMSGNIGDPLFVSTTTGEIQITAPSGNGDVVRIVGYANAQYEIYFHPSRDWGEIGS